MEAEADARPAHDVRREYRLDGLRRYSLAFLVGALVEGGEVQAAADLLEESTVPVNLSLLLDIRGRLRCAQGRFADAVADFLACGERLTARGTRHLGMVPWQFNAALALQRLDQPLDAQRLVDQELEQARRLRVARTRHRAGGGQPPGAAGPDAELRLPATAVGAGRVHRPLQPPSPAPGPWGRPHRSGPSNH
jgi:hypothetical protein